MLRQIGLAEHCVVGVAGVAAEVHCAGEFTNMSAPLLTNSELATPSPGVQGADRAGGGGGVWLWGMWCREWVELAGEGGQEVSVAAVVRAVMKLRFK